MEPCRIDVVKTKVIMIGFNVVVNKIQSPSVKRFFYKEGGMQFFQFFL